MTTENNKLRERIKSLEELLEREHELKETYKHAWIEETSRLAAWSRTWKRACKVWRHRAKSQLQPAKAGCLKERPKVA